ncbi:hypothetical protein PUN28_009432 [Cardiocondyla obscurior]|uniref:Uncharacterized protein n=1 Tax=Cardiocondyla obscurior TaxID=286306 RepID=A0AAW2FTG2_9HYME
MVPSRLEKVKKEEHFSSFISFSFFFFTSLANSAQQAGTANILNTAEPTMVPTPKSPSVTKVPITLIKSSGLELAAAITVAPATSSVTFSSVKHFATFYPPHFVRRRRWNNKR